VKLTPTRRITYVWAILSVITVVASWLGRSSHVDGRFTPSTTVTLLVLAIALVKCRLVIRTFMEVRTAPAWLRHSTDLWLVAFWGAVLILYLA
jgi:Prokaryotic Cytochrome C oxidase subunit IV